MREQVKAKLREYVKEATIEAELGVRVKAHGGLCEKVATIGRRGFFDRIVFLPGGVVYFVELKRPRGGRLSEHQKWYRDELIKLGVAGVVTVKNRDDIDALFADYAAKQRAAGG